jgi:hypothetical protein
VLTRNRRDEFLDRLVGYKLSPLLWRKIRGRLSAGRVQSVAVRLVVEREREIDAFTATEYWSIEANLSQQKFADESERPFFLAKLHKLNGQDPVLVSEEIVLPHIDALEKADWTIGDVRLGQTHPPSRCSIHHEHHAAGKPHAASISTPTRRCVSRSSCTKGLISVVKMAPRGVDHLYAYG